MNSVFEGREEGRERERKNERTNFNFREKETETEQRDNINLCLTSEPMFSVNEHLCANRYNSCRHTDQRAD